MLSISTVNTTPSYATDAKIPVDYVVNWIFRIKILDHWIQIHSLDIQPTISMTDLYLIFVEAIASNSTSELDTGHAMGGEEESGTV